MRLRKRYLCDCELLEKQWLNASYYKLRFSCPEIAQLSFPGQFVNVRYAEHFEPLLRRPMSVFRTHSEEGWFEVLIKVVGKGTSAFSKAQIGDKFSVLGPLGRGFTWEHTEKAILIGGGIGIAPLIFLADVLKNQPIDTQFFLGFRSQDEVCCLADVKQTVQGFQVTTEDGSYGTKGLVTDQFNRFLQERVDWRKATVFACGPNPMLAALEDICDAYGMPAQFSLEAHMACGFGVCVGCAVKAKNKEDYYLVCEQGPVFNLGEVDLGG